MTKNYVCRTPCLSRHTSFDCVKIMDISRWWWGVFWGVRSEGKRQKMAQNDKKSSHSTPYLRNCTWLWILVHMCKMMISPENFFSFIFYFFSFFSFFQNFYFLGFSKLINKIPKGNSEVWPTFFTCVWILWYIMTWYTNLSTLNYPLQYAKRLVI